MVSLVVMCAGDVEADFWLSLDLLRSGKDHAEFTLVRDWVRNALQVGLPALCCCPTLSCCRDQVPAPSSTVLCCAGALAHANP